MKKKYEYLNGVSASLTINVAGITKSILFDGGRKEPFFTRPKYKTSDKDEQEALESSPFFDNLIFLASEEAEEIKPNLTLVPPVGEEEGEGDDLLKQAESNEGAKVDEIKTDENGDLTITKGDEEIVVPADAIIVDEIKAFEEVTKVQEAREVLIVEFEVKAAELPNKEAILAKAAELKVSFPNL